MALIRIRGHSGREIMIEKKSMSKSRRRYTTQFKADAVRLAKAPGVSVRQVAKNLGVAEQSLHAWIKAECPEDGGLEAKETISRLEAEVRQLRMERDILKKSLGLFVRPT